MADFILTKDEQTFSDEYRAYIKSAAWYSRRNRFLDSYGRTCVACGVPNDLHVHHLDYTNMGKEPDCDLMILCDLCHVAVHRVNNDPSRMKCSLRENTHYAVAKIQQGQGRRLTKRQKRSIRKNLYQNGSLATLLTHAPIEENKRLIYSKGKQRYVEKDQRSMSMKQLQLEQYKKR